MASLQTTVRDADELAHEVAFPVVSTLLVVRGFLPLVQKSQAKNILIVSSIVGSLTIAANIPDLGNGYSIARAALNMYVKHRQVIWGITGIQS
jgi:NAD(P)-dependent dehydrogenase (short-subunit alcohol dehydrogenase family)